MKILGWILLIANAGFGVAYSDFSSLDNNPSTHLLVATFIAYFLGDSK